MTSRLPSRPLTMLLLIAAAFSAGPASFTLARFTQDVVCVSDHIRQQPQPASEPKIVPLAPRTNQPVVAPIESEPSDPSFVREFFQRPPPALLWSRS